MSIKRLFFSSYPEQKVVAWCHDCLKDTVQVGGILVSRAGIEVASVCDKCQHISVDEDIDLFEEIKEINKKLDRLLSHLGLGPDW